MPRFSICFANKINSVGGAGTFLNNFQKYLKKKKYLITDFNKKQKIDYIFVTGASLRNIIPILLNKISGSKIINRVDGKLWIHKYSKIGHSGYLISIIQNFLIIFFKLISDKVIYQSSFIQKSWNNKFIKKKSVIIYNATQPRFINRNFNKTIKPTLISVEGSIDGAFNAVKLFNKIKKDYRYEIYGYVSQGIKSKFHDKKNLHFFGQVSRDKIKKILKRKKKYIFISLEMKAPCPNSVIEAINHGIPVIGYNQGSMSEIINKKQGKLLNVNKYYEFEEKELSKAIKEINDNYYRYNKKLKNIDEKFKLDYMLKKYVNEIYKT